MAEYGESLGGLNKQHWKSVLGRYLQRENVHGAKHADTLLRDGEILTAGDPLVVDGVEISQIRRGDTGYVLSATDGNARVVPYEPEFLAFREVAEEGIGAFLDSKDQEPGKFVNPFDLNAKRRLDGEKP